MTTAAGIVAPFPAKGVPKEQLCAFFATDGVFEVDRITPKILIKGFLAEQLLRVYKRKQHQVMTFRSFDSLDFLCKSLGTVASLRAQGENLYESVASIFDRPMGAAGNIVT